MPARGRALALHAVGSTHSGMSMVPSGFRPAEDGWGACRDHGMPGPSPCRATGNVVRRCPTAPLG
jgi:hypothetical protein